MMITTYIGFIVIGFYSITVLILAFGWKRLELFKISDHFKPLNISIIIACRNEENNILDLLKSLNNQNYPKENTEIIVVNDHSSDQTRNIISGFIKDFRQFKLLDLAENKAGKKEALAFGIQHAKSEIIITTDADCRMNEKWIQSMVNYYVKNKPRILAGPVSLIRSKDIFHKMQALEFLSLIVSGAGAIGLNRAIMCNGANLLFEKSLYEKSNTQKTIASGDDIFLMLQAKENDKRSIHFIRSKEAIVQTKPAKSILEFFNQRIRWTSKSKAYRDFDIVFTAIIVALANFVLASSLFYSFYDHSFFKLFVSAFILKSIVDLVILIPASGFFDQQKLLWLFIPLQFIYPIYIILTVIMGLTGKFRWKERSFGEKR